MMRHFFFFFFQQTSGNVFKSLLRKHRSHHRTLLAQRTLYPPRYNSAALYVHNHLLGLPSIVTVSGHQSSATPPPLHPVSDTNNVSPMKSRGQSITDSTPLLDGSVCALKEEFVIDSAPGVHFSSNQRLYQSSLAYSDGSGKHAFSSMGFAKALRWQ